jgi:thiamine biosynthesis protein ThiS
MTEITITLNGKKHHLKASVSIDTLLTSIGLGDKPVVVELNQKALFPREYGAHTLTDGDQVEIISIAAGG